MDAPLPGVKCYANDPTHWVLAFTGAKGLASFKFRDQPFLSSPCASCCSWHLLPLRALSHSPLGG